MIFCLIWEESIFIAFFNLFITSTMWKTSLFYSPLQTIWKFSKIPLTVDKRHLQRKLKIGTEFSLLIFKLSLWRENLPYVSSINQLFVKFTHTFTVLYHLTLVLLKGSLPSSYKFDTGTKFFSDVPRLN